MRRCNRCGSIVFKSELPEYLYQCFNCDEDLYSFETYEDGTNIENALLDELYVYVLREYNNGILSEKDQKRYVEIVDMLQSKGVEIPFGIEIQKQRVIQFKNQEELL